MKMSLLSGWMRAVFLLLVLLMGGCTNANGHTFSAGAGTGGAADPLVSRRSTEPPVDAKTAVIAVPESFPAPDPLGFDKWEQELTPVESFCYAGLLAAMPNQTYGAGLASEYRAQKRNGKAEIVIRLRQGVKWSDGQPVTVEDVQYTLETYARPDYYGIWRKQMAIVAGVSPFRAGRAEHISGIVTDAVNQTVRIQLDREDRSFLQTLTAPLLSRRQGSKKSMEELEMLSRTGQLMGAGPFQADSVQAAGWHFRANSHYFAGPPRLKALQVRPLASGQVPRAIQEGIVHIGWVSPREAARLSNHLPDNARILQTDAIGYQFLGFNLDAPAVSDREVRRALAEALSPKEIGRDRFFGVAKIADGPLPPRSFAHGPNFSVSYDPQEAARTLAKKGYSHAKPLQLTIVYPDDVVRERLFQSVQEAWRSLPVKLEAKAMPADDFAAYVFGASPYDLYLYGWKDGQNPLQLSKLWHSREKTGELGVNASNYRNEQADRLLDVANGFLPHAEQKRLYVQWQKRFASDVPIVPLIRLPNYYLVSKQLHGVEVSAAIHPFGSVWKWTLAQ